MFWFVLSEASEEQRKKCIPFSKSECITKISLNAAESLGNFTSSQCNGRVVTLAPFMNNCALLSSF